jgi:hypothetical protein
MMINTKFNADLFTGSEVTGLDLAGEKDDICKSLPQI